MVCLSDQRPVYPILASKVFFRNAFMRCHPMVQYPTRQVLISSTLHIQIQNKDSSHALNVRVYIYII